MSSVIETLNEKTLDTQGRIRKTLQPGQYEQFSLEKRSGEKAGQVLVYCTTTNDKTLVYGLKTHADVDIFINRKGMRFGLLRKEEIKFVHRVFASNRLTIKVAEDPPSFLISHK